MNKSDLQILDKELLKLGDLVIDKNEQNEWRKYGIVINIDDIGKSIYWNKYNEIKYLFKNFNFKKQKFGTTSPYTQFRDISNLIMEEWNIHFIENISKRNFRIEVERRLKND